MGCADIVAAEGVLVHRQRHGDSASITCRSSSSGTTRSWNVSCQDDRWVVPGGLRLNTLLDNCTQLLPGIYSYSYSNFI